MAIKIKGQVVIDDNQNIVSSGEAIATNFKTGTTNVHSSGIEVSGINILGGDTPIGSGTTISANGAATFAGGSVEIRSNGETVIDRTSGSNGCLSVRLNGTENGRINADGSATFASYIQSGGDPWQGAAVGTKLFADGSIATNQTTATNKSISVFNGGTDPTAYIQANGSANFAGTIDAAGFTVNGQALSSGGSGGDASTLSGMAPATDSTGDTIAQRHNNGSLSMTYTYTQWVQARTDINTAFSPAAYVVMQDGWYYHLNKADMKSALDVGFIPQHYTDTAYTLAADDKGKHIKSSGQNITVPSGVFSTGDVVTIYNYSYGSATLTQGSGVTMYHAGSNGSTGNRSLANFALATILCTGSNEFVVSGTGVS